MIIIHPCFFFLLLYFSVLLGIKLTLKQCCVYIYIYNKYARIKFKAFIFTYKTTTGSAPLYLNSILQTYVPSRNLRSASEQCIIVPSQRGTKSLSLTLPTWWNDLPNSIRAAESLAIFKKRLKIHIFHPSLFDSLTVALSILNLFYLSVLFL